MDAGKCYCSQLTYVAFFLGCAPDSRTGQDETHVDDEASNQATSSDFNEEMPEDPSYSSDEFNYLNGFFRLSPDGSSAYPIENLNEITWADVVEGFSEDFRYRMFSSCSEDSELVTIDRSKGEQLVVMGEASEYCADGSEKVELVVEYGYWSGEGEGGTSGCFLDEVNGVSIEDAGSEEINAAVSGSGIEYIAADTIGFFASPDKNAKVSWGQYQGTDFAEGTRSLNTRFFLGRHDDTALNPDMDSEIYPAWIEVTKTKEGYFVFDVSKLDSGVYYTDLIVDDLCYAFEIV